jgi:methionyl-tRNA formyltransferase
MDIIFMGTPEFAVPCLELLVNQGHHISCVVTQPDKPRGRGNRISYSQVKEKALELGIPVIQPINIKKDMECINKLKSFKPFIIVVVAFGQILSQEILSIPQYGCINVHASLLPKFRGAAPINWAIINGYKKTGITTMLMDKGLDTGDILLSEETSIDDDETSGELHDRLKIMGGRVLIETLKCIENGTLKKIPQNDSESTYAPMINKETGRINWNSKSQNIRNLVKGTNPFPGSYCYLNNAKIKVWRAEIDKAADTPKNPGEVWKVDREGIHVYTSDGGLIIKEVQSENSKRTDAFSYTLGHTINIGIILE